MAGATSLASSSLVSFIQDVPLPLLFFNHNLHLTFFNNAAERVLGPSVNDHPNAAFFFNQELEDADNATMLSSVTIRLDEIVEEGRHLDWGVGSKVQLWVGRKGERKSRWYEAALQNLSSPDHIHEETGAPLVESPGRHGLSVLLLRRLPAEQIPSASLPLISSSVAGLRASPTDEEKKHREQDTGLTHLYGKFAEPQGLTHAQLQTIFDFMPHICFTTTPEGQPAHYNKRWFEQTGFTLEDAKDAQKWMALHHADDMPSALGKWRYSWETGAPLDAECRFRNLDGSWRWVATRYSELTPSCKHLGLRSDWEILLRGNPVRDSAGIITHWVLTITDIDELVQTRCEAVKVKEHIKAVLNGANVLLLSVAQDSVVTFFGGSSAMTSAITISEDQVVGSLLENVWPDPGLHDEVEKMITEHKESVSFQNEVKSHGRIYRYRLTLLYSQEVGDMEKNVLGVIIVASDATDIEAAAATLQQAEVERTNLMASETAAREASMLKTHFVTNISHEIRTPIAHMIGISELLLADPTLSENQRDLVEKCLHSGEILLELVGMVLDMGKVEAGKLELEQNLFRLSDVLADAELFVLAAQKKGLKFIPDVFPSLYASELIGDRLRLRQVLANFLSNAVKFTSRGSITLRMRDEPGSRPSEVMVTIEVQDTGCGIEAEALQRLFTPFQQADSSTMRQFGGSGLGLFLSQSFVEKMGGHITLLSEYGKGAIISARIPFTKADVFLETSIRPLTTPSTGSLSPNGPARMPDQTQALNRQDVRLLLVDDNDLIREIMHKILTKMNFVVDAVSDGTQAVQAAQTGKYHLILMDGQMPGMDGYEATKRIRQSTSTAVRNIKVIALTASAIRGDKERCLEAGMDAYLPKPVRAKALEEAILQQLTSIASRRSRDMTL
ncbi:hypothetical protein FRB95_014366 [Tulasnella sp. JGI-2019a]|nr:hypothetical protein FRB95_014366 [Tulasnella sp. JGI-2019a]